MTVKAHEISLDWEACCRIAGRMRYWDGIRPEDGEDFAQDVALEMMEWAGRNGGSLSPREMWRAARCVRNRYWRAYKQVILSLNAPVADAEGVELWETIPEKTPDLDAWLEAKLRLEEVPPGVVRIGKKLEKGDPLTPNQRAFLTRFRKDGKPSPQQVWGRKYYRSHRSQGLCVNCGEESGGFARCPRCREKQRAYQGQYRRSKGAAWQRTLRAQWRQQGRCPRCGRWPEPERKKCPQCLARDREDLCRHRMRVKVRERYEQWLGSTAREFNLTSEEIEAIMAGRR